MSTPLQIGPVTIRNRVFLAPMSGVTDLPFRERAYDAGAGLVVSEMVASGELAKGRGDTARRIRRFSDAPHVVQLAGREAWAMAEAARIAEGEGADIVDINMGCPAKKVTGGYCGSALMRDPDHAVSLIDAVVGAVKVPVTVKMRLGWDDESRNAPVLAVRAEQAGVKMVTMHGRTRCQFYEGSADWVAIASVKQAISVPLVVNGDIGSIADAEKALTLSGADAVMVGRASYGAPWTAGTIATQAAAQPNENAPCGDALASYVVSHYKDILALYGVESGLRQARKHLGWYLDRHVPSVSVDLRHTIMRSFEPAAVIAALRQAFDHETRFAVAA
ncbi:MAG: tRNA dihydrouridine synthase DusB [Rhizobiaceae bacterium]